MFEIGDFVEAAPYHGTCKIKPFKGFLERRYADGRYAVRLSKTKTPPPSDRTMWIVVEESSLTYIGYKVGDAVRVKDRARKFRDDEVHGPSPYGTVVELKPELGGVLVKHEDGSGPFGWTFDELEPAGRSSILRLLDGDGVSPSEG